MQNLYPPPPPSLIPFKPFDQPRRLFGEVQDESGGGRRVTSPSWTSRRRAGYAARGSKTPHKGLPAPETGARSSRADAHPDSGRLSALLARAASVDSSRSGKPERGVSPRGPPHAPNTAIAHSSIAIDPGAAHRALKARNSPHCISPHLPSWRDRPVVAESSCVETRRRHFPGNLIFRNTPSIYRYLSNFTGIFRNSIFSNETARLRHHTRPRPEQRGGNCGQMRVVSNGMRRISSGCREGLRRKCGEMRPAANPLLGAVEKPISASS